MSFHPGPPLICVLPLQIACSKQIVRGKAHHTRSTVASVPSERNVFRVLLYDDAFSLSICVWQPFVRVFLQNHCVRWQQWTLGQKLPVETGLCFFGWNGRVIQSLQTETSKICHCCQHGFQRMCEGTLLQLFMSTYCHLSFLSFANVIHKYNAFRSSIPLLPHNSSRPTYSPLSTSFPPLLFPPPPSLQSTERIL